MIIVNDFRERKTKEPIRAMIHRDGGICHRKWGVRQEWSLRYPTIEAAEDGIGGKLGSTLVRRVFPD